jgi:BirA family transcriptional regulator, biotin operon repressor / biotin---[acetyl-CoA-carboxylase] ligase
MQRMASGTAILEAFYKAAGQFVSVDVLAKQMQTSSVALDAEIRELQQLGYRIEAHPHFGYRLLDAPDRLTADDIRAQLRARVIGSQVLVFEQTASTNDVVEHLAQSQVDEGLTVFAESQTKGRGRHGRAWISPHGKGLWFSVLLRPQFPLPRVTVAASVAVASVVRKTGLDARIKWPNDVTVNGRKLAGILTEASDKAAILGVGINVNCRPDEIPADTATSLLIETGKLQDRIALAADVLSALDRYYSADFDVVVAEWARLCTTLGRQLVVTMGARRIEGHAQALDGDGALLLRRDNGQVERILGADVTVEK